MTTRTPIEEIMKELSYRTDSNKTVLRLDREQLRRLIAGFPNCSNDKTIRNKERELEARGIITNTTRIHGRTVLEVDAEELRAQLGHRPASGACVCVNGGLKA